MFDKNQAANQVFICPKCGERMEPLLLEHNIWWTCSAVKTKKCQYPLMMPKEVFWVTRTTAEKEAGIVPPPKLDLLPVRYHSLYPALFSASRATSTATTSHCATRERSLGSVATTASLSTTATFSTFASSFASSVDVDERNIADVRRKIGKIPTLRMTIGSGSLPASPLPLPSVTTSNSNYAATVLNCRYGGERRAEMVSTRKSYGRRPQTPVAPPPALATVDLKAASAWKTLQKKKVSFSSVSASDHAVLASNRTAMGRKRPATSDDQDDEEDSSAINALVAQKIEQYKATQKVKRRKEREAKAEQERQEAEKAQERADEEMQAELPNPFDDPTFQFEDSFPAFEDGFDEPIEDPFDNGLFY